MLCKKSPNIQFAPVDSQGIFIILLVPKAIQNSIVKQIVSGTPTAQPLISVWLQNCPRAFNGQLDGLSYKLIIGSGWNMIKLGFLPPYPGKQWQMNWLTPSSQEPPLMQGFEAHSFTSDRHLQKQKDLSSFVHRVWIFLDHLTFGQ